MAENALMWAAERGVAVLAMLMLYRIIVGELSGIKVVLGEIRDKL